MSGAIVWATALYHAHRPGEITVGGEQVPYQHAGAVPSLRALVTTPWSAAPGAIWEEHRDGLWSLPVFRHEPGAT